MGGICFLLLLTFLCRGAAHSGPSNAAVMFASTDEVEETKLSVTGVIPHWLSCTLIRNSPAGYENGADEMRHMFDAWAKLNMWKIKDGEVTHQSQYLNSTSYAMAVETASISQEGYGTPKNPGKRTPGERDDDAAKRSSNQIPSPRLRRDTAIRDNRPPSSSRRVAGGDDPNDRFMVNPMVNVWKFDDKYMATTDQNLYIEFDAATGDVLGDVNAAFDQTSDPITAKGVQALAAAHPRYDRFLRQHYNVEMDLKPKGAEVLHKPATYNVWRYNETGEAYAPGETLPPREIIASFSSDDASYVHSFALSEKYVVIVQCPFTYDFATLMTSDVIEDSTTWNEKGHTTVHVIDRNSGEILQQITDDGAPWFIYHALNAYDDGEEVVVHLSRYDNSTLIDFGMKLENIVDEPKLYVPTYTQARLNECRVNVRTGALKCEEVVGDTFEMATFNWVDKHMQQPQYAWAANMASPNTPWSDGESDWIDQIVKVDLSSKAVVGSWKQEGAYNCEVGF